ncbi:MAG: DNA internalization-related competence protein ComEC/Rec2 [Lachnospiraceae bacterium]|nr:DNA internalization-related competence protein ComEC/Rec2 [Lachnospiraceae bacterium]
MRRPLLLAAICLTAVMGVLLRLGIFDRVPQGQIGTEMLTDGEPVTAVGQVYQKDSEKIYLRTIRITSSADNSQPFLPCKENLICILGREADVPLGSVVLVEGTFEAFSAAANPGEFDSRDYYRTLGIGGKVKDAALLEQGNSYWRFRETLYGIRSLLKQRLGKVLPGKEAAVMCALLLGDKGDLDPELKELYQRNGILHILSISSLHITMIGMTVYQLLRKCRVPVFPAAVSGSILLFLYGMMTGFSVSACRAIGMYLLRMTAEIIGRTYDMPTAAGVMAAVLTVKNPYYLRHSGFLLSFTSMIGIGAVYPAMASGSEKPDNEKGDSEIWSSRKKKGKRKLLKAVLSGLSITLATLPVQLWFYYQIPTYSVLLNILVLPFMELLMAAGFLALIPGLGIFGRIDWLILQGYESLCGWFNGFPCHTWNPGKPGLWQVIVYYLILAAVMCCVKGMRAKESKAHKECKGKRHKIVFAACFTVLALNVFVIGWQPPAENQLLFLDVGQGDGILVRTASGENILFDCGSSSRSRVGKYVLLPCLRYYGIHTLDAVILSHPDGDHVNGVMELLSMGQDSGIEIKQLVLPKLCPEGRAEMLERLGEFAEREDWSSRISIGCLSSGESFSYDRAAFLCLHPESGWTGKDANAYSLCVYGVFMDENGEKEMDFLMTGDVEADGEEALLAALQEKGIRNLSVLKTAHHGSKNSTSERLLAQLTPMLSVISCGRNNRYGHPHKELLERLEGVDSVTMITGQKGAVKVSFYQEMIKVETFRENRRSAF